MRLRLPEPHPIFRREMVATLRSPWMRLAAAAYLLGPFVAIAWQWPENQMQTGGFYGGAQSNDLVAAFFYCQAALTAVVFWALGSFAISTEKENGTYEFLFTTRMRPSSFGLAKLGAIFTVGLLLFASSLPALSTVFHLGGVDAGMMAEAGGILFAIALITGVTSLMCSCVFAKGIVALLASGGVFTLCGSLLFLFLEHSTRRSPNTLEIALLGAAAYVAVIFLPIVIALAGRAPAERHRPRRKVVNEPSDLWARRNQWPYYIVDPAKRAEPIPDRCNPITTKELLTNTLFRTAWRWRLAYGSFVAVMVLVLLFCFLPEPGYDPYTGWGYLGYSGIPRNLVGLLLSFGGRFELLWKVVLTLAVAFTLLANAVLFAGEHEGRTIEMLKLTRVTPAEYLVGKWSACWKFCWPYVTLLVLLAPLTDLSPTRWWADGTTSDWLNQLLLGLLLIETAMLSATLLAILTRRTRVAIIGTAGIVLIMNHWILNELKHSSGPWASDISLLMPTIALLGLLGVGVIMALLQREWRVKR